MHMYIYTLDQGCGVIHVVFGCVPVHMVFYNGPRGRRYFCEYISIEVPWVARAISTYICYLLVH